MMNRVSKMTLLAWLLVLASFGAQAQQEARSLASLEQKLDSLILTRMNLEHIPGVAFILIKDGKVLLKKGYGYARLGPGMQKVEPDSTIFRIGSISKTFTVTALLQLADKRKIDLHKNVNGYLKRIQVEDTFKNPVTASNLLSHSAGFDEIGKGRVVYAKDQLIPLATFLKNRLIRIRPAGVVPAYSTYGIALAGLMIEDVSNLPLESYFKKNLWEPLGMNSTSIEVPASEQGRTALGYEYEDGVNTLQPWEWYHTFPASSINSTVSDMGRYMQMHLNAGALNKKRILRKKSAQKMQTQQLSIHPKVDGFGYGFYKEDWQGVKTFDHGGDMAGFSSYMTLSVEDNMGIFIVHHHENASLRRDVVSAIIKHFHPITVKQAPQKSLVFGANTTAFAGEYRWLSNCSTCPGSDKQYTWQLKRNADGTLTGFKRTYVQVEPLLFKSTDGESMMGFKKDAAGKVQYMTLGNINVFEKVVLK